MTSASLWKRAAIKDQTKANLCSNATPQRQLDIPPGMVDNSFRGQSSVISDSRAMDVFFGVEPTTKMTRMLNFWASIFQVFRIALREIKSSTVMQSTERHVPASIFGAVVWAPASSALDYFRTSRFGASYFTYVKTADFKYLSSVQEVRAEANSGSSHSHSLCKSDEENEDIEEIVIHVTECNRRDVNERKRDFHSAQLQQCHCMYLYITIPKLNLRYKVENNENFPALGAGFDLFKNFSILFQCA
uniref:Uncharacterized protein n=1 Tax=Romanomermis culicivorax TaxID=13658 RepID=A0A915KF98_ROMCU